MYIISPPEGFVEVTEQALEEFLSRCADYRSLSYVGHRRYYFAHDPEARSFAVIHRDKVYADPKLLE